MSANRIKVETHTVKQAGVDMGVAANTTHEVLGSVAVVSQPATAATFGEPHLASVFSNFWTALRQQVQLSGDVFAELGKRLGGTAVKLDNGDIQNSNSINSVAPAGTTPATTAPTTPAATTPGGDNAPPPATTAPAPPTPTTPQDPNTGGGDVNSPGGGVSAPGSTTGV